MRKAIKVAALGPLLALVFGCAGNPGPGARSFTVISLEPGSGCRTVGELKVTGASKAEIKEKLKEEAGKRKANYIHLRDLTRNRNTGVFTAYATACTCR